MGTITKDGKSWVSQGDATPYDLKRAFLGGKGNVYTGNTGDINPGSPKLMAWWRADNLSSDWPAQGSTVSNMAGKGFEGRYTLTHDGGTSSRTAPPYADGETPSSIISAGAFDFWTTTGYESYYEISTDSADDEPVTEARDFVFSKGGQDLPFSVSFWFKPMLNQGGYAMSHNDPFIGVERDDDGDGDPDKDVWKICWNHLNGGLPRLLLYDTATPAYHIFESATFDWSATGADPEDLTALDEWHHCVVTYDGTGGGIPLARSTTSQVAPFSPGDANPGAHEAVCFYINGVKRDVMGDNYGSDQFENYTCMAGTTVDEGAAVSLTLGADPALNPNFHGYLTDVAIWRGVLNEESAKALYYAKDKVSYLTRNWAKKGSSAKSVGHVQNDLAGVNFGQGAGLEIDDFLEGYDVDSFKILYMSTQPKIHANSDAIKLVNGRPVDLKWFNDNSSPTNFGTRNVSETGVTVVTGSSAVLDSTQGGSGVTLAPNHKLENRDLGMTSLGVDDRPWTDMDRYNPEVIVSSDPWEVMIPSELLGASFSVYSKDIDAMTGGVHQNTSGSFMPMWARPSDSYSGISLMDGVIEPFPIRSVVDRSIIDVPFQTRGIRAGYEAEDVFRRSIFIEDQYMVDGPSLAPWMDSAELFGTDVTQQSGSWTLMGVVIDDPTPVKPFNDTTDLVIRYQNIRDSEIRNTLTTIPYLSGSTSMHFGQGGEGTSLVLNSIDFSHHPMGTRQSDLKRGHVYASHGFDYMDSTLGADSIVYGGLKR